MLSSAAADLAYAAILVAVHIKHLHFLASLHILLQEEDGEGEWNRDRLRGRESCSCFCNVMLNSNMQCSHHGNGGSSEATHGAESVFLLASLCVCVSMCLCFCVKVHRNMQSLTGEDGEGAETKTFRSLKQKRSIFFSLSLSQP